MVWIAWVQVLMLHSSIQSGDQRRVFNRPPEGKRKVTANPLLVASKGSSLTNPFVYRWY